MYKKFYRVRVDTLRKGLTFYVEASNEDEAMGVVYHQIMRDNDGMRYFVKFIYVEEIKPE